MWLGVPASLARILFVPSLPGLAKELVAGSGCLVPFFAFFVLLGGGGHQVGGPVLNIVLALLE